MARCIPQQHALIAFASLDLEEPMDTWANDLLAITTSELVHARRLAITGTMTDLIAIDAPDLNPIGHFRGLLGTALGCMTKL